MSDESYTITCTGMWCQEETDWDQATPSDEYYAIVTVFGRTSAGTLTSSTTRVPASKSAWEGIDSGDWRRCDIAVWDGPLHHFELHAQLMEEDQGDSTLIQKMIEAAAAEAIEQGSTAGGLQVSDTFENEVAKGFVALFNLQDDQIGPDQSRHFNSAKLAKLVKSKLFKTKPERIPYRFRTLHNGDGASVTLYYDITVS